MHLQKLGKRLAVAVIIPLLLAAQQADTATEAQAPADVRALLEGTWELEEWHLDGQVLRPPQIGGRWSNHDGVVMATFHRTSGNSFESFAGYGTYEMDATTWSYRYERSETARGASVEDAKLTVATSGERRRFKIIRASTGSARPELVEGRAGPTIILEGTGDRREYDDRTFSYMPNGRLLRKYRKLR